jgi:putative ABC transport system permease protein
LLVEIERMQDSNAHLSARPRFNAMLLSWFASIGLVLAAFGIYGVLGFLVAARTREIGIRIALGATPESVVRMILGSAARWLAAGLLIGLALSIAIAQALRSLLLGISTYDPLAWTTAAAVLVTTALIAAWYPSHRASRIDPLDALREE